MPDHDSERTEPSGSPEDMIPKRVGPDDEGHDQAGGHASVEGFEVDLTDPLDNWRYDYCFDETTWFATYEAARDYAVAALMEVAAGLAEEATELRSSPSVEALNLKCPRLLARARARAERPDDSSEDDTPDPSDAPHLPSGDEGSDFESHRRTAVSALERMATSYLVVAREVRFARNLAELDDSTRPLFPEGIDTARSVSEYLRQRLTVDLFRLL
jgi:hypothetical protein